MFRKAYDLIREILDDQQLGDYVLQQTGKHLAVIDAGAKVTAPCAAVSLNGGAFSHKFNTSTEIEYLVSFALPFWGADAFIRCIDFIDFALPIFFDYRDKRNFILRVTPAIHELDEQDSRIWTVDFLITVSAFII